MKQVITGRVRVVSSDADQILSRAHNSIRKTRFVHDLEKLMVAGVLALLEDAGIDYPAGTQDIGMYLCMDDIFEEIKNEFFRDILKQGSEGASPLLFPYTAPNAFSARVSIIFDLRGESILFPVNNKWDNMIKYAFLCVSKGYSRMAITGGIRTLPGTLEGYEGRMYFIENEKSALERNARIYGYIDERNYEDLLRD